MRINVIESNELSKNARGGTELMLEGLHNHVDSSLLNKFQIIPTRVRELDPDRQKILWMHDLWADPECKHFQQGAASWDRFAKIVFVSNWQFQSFRLAYGLPYEKSIVLRNAIRPIEPVEKPHSEIRLIYHTTPHRGLNLLLACFDKIVQDHPEVMLDVYSSFELYGWKERDAEFQNLFDFCRQHDNIRYHGAVSNEEVRAALAQAHIFAYPSTWEETSCLSMIEAMSAGCRVVHSSLGALPETSAGFTYMYPFDETPEKHLLKFHYTLDMAIRDIKANRGQATVDMGKMYIDNLYSWDTRAKEWEGLLKSLDKENEIVSKI